MSLSAPNKETRLPDHDELLLDYALRLKKHLAGRRAIHLQFSRLGVESLRGQNLKIAVDFFTGLVQRHEGQYFFLKNKDLMVIVKGATVAQIDEVVLKLRYLFSDDPLVHDDGEANGSSFCTWFALETDYAKFLQTVRDLHDGYRDREQRSDAPETPKAVQPRDLPAPSKPLTPERLVQLESAIASFDLTSIVRRQMIAIIVPGTTPKPVFNEAYCSTDELRYRLMPEVDLMSDRWLFQRLTTTLDRRLLKILPDLERTISLTTSIKLHVATVLDDAFLAFDREIHRQQGKSMILELQSFDLIADMGAFAFARNFAHERGYKICIDGLSGLNLPLLQREHLGVDFAKISWQTEGKESVPAEKRQNLAEAIRRAGVTRVILSHCDDEQAIEFGRSIGITLFQGRYVDTLLT